MSNPFFSPLLKVRCDRLGQFPDDCRDLGEVTSDSALVQHSTPSTNQQSLLPPLSNFLGHEGQSSLIDGCCPYCQAWLEGTTFTGEDGRNGGLARCQLCQLAFVWIDSPFECEIFDNIYCI